MKSDKKRKKLFYNNNKRSKKLRNCNISKLWKKLKNIKNKKDKKSKCRSKLGPSESSYQLKSKSLLKNLGNLGNNTISIINWM